MYANAYQQVSRQVAEVGGLTKEYFVTHYGARAGIVVERAGRILLTRQRRLLIPGLSWEIPGGRVNDGERPAAAAVRECLEETGVRARGVRPLIRFMAGVDMIDNPTDVFSAHDGTAEPSRRDRQEAEPPVWVPLARCLEMIFRYQIRDSLSIISLLAYARRGERGR